MLWASAMEQGFAAPIWIVEHQVCVSANRQQGIVWTEYKIRSLDRIHDQLPRLQAASYAQKAVDYLHGLQPQPVGTILWLKLETTDTAHSILPGSSICVRGNSDWKIRNYKTNSFKFALCEFQISAFFVRDRHQNGAMVRSQETQVFGMSGLYPTIESFYRV
jgi:hypothetical protein